MVSSPQKTKSPVMESATGFVLGAVAGGTLGAVDQIMTGILSGTQLHLVAAGISGVGALGLGLLLGTTALITSMTTAVTGVVAAAAVALLSLRVRKSEGWVASGLAAGLASTSTGAALGVIVEKLSASYGMGSLLWALGIFTVLKVLAYVFVKFAFCGAVAEDWKKEQARLLAMEVELRRRVAMNMEKRVIACEMEKLKEEDRAAWEAQQKEMKRQQRKIVELEMQKRISGRRLLKAVDKCMEFLALSGIPMTATAFLTAGFGVFGFGEHRFVFVTLLVSVLCISFWLVRPRRLNFWKLTGCMAMFATFAVGVLTVHAGREVAVRAGFFVCEVCQVGLGAAVAGPAAREAGGPVVVGASGMAVAVLGIVEVSALRLGVGGTAGALLGAAGAAGVCMGGAAGKSSSWGGTLGTSAGMIFGLLLVGKWGIVKIGVHVCVAHVFAMTNLH